jgi:hypothetical protein
MTPSTSSKRTSTEPFPSQYASTDTTDPAGTPSPSTVARNFPSTGRISSVDDPQAADAIATANAAAHRIPLQDLTITSLREKSARRT